MEVPMSTLWEEAMVDAFRQTAREIAHLLPKLFALLTFLLRILRAVRFDLLCERFGLTQALVKAGIKQPISHLVARLSFWIVFLVFALMGLDALALPATANLMSLVIGFLPH